MTTPDTSTLAGKIAVMQAALDGKTIRSSIRGENNYIDTYPIWDWDTYDYRIAPSQPTTVPWDSPDDVPGPVCWVRRESWFNGECALIIAIADEGVWVGDGRDLDTRFRQWKWFDSQKVFHSTDRKTWKPCVKEVEHD